MESTTQGMSGAEFVEHWRKMAAEGRLNRNTALALQTACRHILTTEPGWESMNVAALSDEQAEALLARFRERATRDGFQEKTIAEYQRRFRQALGWLRAYLEAPQQWSAPSAQRKPAGKRAPRAAAARPQQATRAARSKAPSKPRAAKRGASAAKTAEVAGDRATASIEYPFPVRPGFVARLLLPTDLTESEAKRLAAFLDALALAQERVGK